MINLMAIIHTFFRLYYSICVLLLPWLHTDRLPSVVVDFTFVSSTHYGQTDHDEINGFCLAHNFAEGHESTGNSENKFDNFHTIRIPAYHSIPNSLPLNILRDRAPPVSQ